jgi:hypothetical protein
LPLGQASPRRGLRGFLDTFRLRHKGEVDRRKFEADLIMNAIKTGDIEQAINNLRFLVEAGLVRGNEVF